MDAAESVAESALSPAAGQAVRGSRSFPSKHPGDHPGTTAATAGSGDGAGLSEREEAILAFERQWWKYEGRKEQAIREHFGLSSTRYYQILNRLMDKHEAMVLDPMLVKRLLRMRAGRSRNRTARKLGIDSR